MKTARYSPTRMAVWGDSLLNKLPALSRKRRKRDASKKRRAAVKRDFPAPDPR